MSSEVSRQLSFKEIMTLISVFLITVGTISSVVYKFAQHDSAIRQTTADVRENKVGVAALKKQELVVAEVRLLVNVINIAIKEIRTSRKEMVKKFDESLFATSQKIVDLTIGQNDIRNQLKSYQKNHKEHEQLSLGGE